MGRVAQARDGWLRPHLQRLRRNTLGLVWYAALITGDRIECRRLERGQRQGFTNRA